MRAYKKEGGGGGGKETKQKKHPDSFGGWENSITWWSFLVQ